MTVTRIISGGQTGVDRGALLAARDLGLMRGGWAPRGWLAEDGVIPAKFRDGMQECPQRGYSARTRRNADDSDGTLILSRDLPLTGGTLMTERFAIVTGAPVLVLSLSDESLVTDAVVASKRLHEWLEHNRISVLNVAGPRESKAPGIQEQSRAVLVALLRSK